VNAKKILSNIIGINIIGVFGIILVIVPPLLEQPYLKTSAELDWGDSHYSTLGTLSITIHNNHDSQVNFRLKIETDDNLTIKKDVHSEIQFSENECYVGPKADWEENFFVYPVNRVDQKHWIQIRVENPATLDIYNLENKEFGIGEHVDFFK